MNESSHEEEARAPLLPAPIEPNASNSLNPSDHVRMIVELLRPTGPDLARRWLAALLLVDISDRESVVDSIERQIAETYAPTVTNVTVPISAQKKAEFLDRGSGKLAAAPSRVPRETPANKPKSVNAR